MLKAKLLGHPQPVPQKPLAAVEPIAVPQDLQLWKQNVLKSKMHGNRATVYIPATKGATHTYTGQWARGRKEGFGENLTKKTKYEGMWKDGMQDGEGTLFLRDNESSPWKRVYKGGWKEDKRHGRGVNWYENGDVYDGFLKTTFEVPSESCSL